MNTTISKKNNDNTQTKTYSHTETHGGEIWHGGGDQNKQALYSIITQFYLERFVEIDNIPVFSTN